MEEKSVKKAEETKPAATEEKPKATEEKPRAPPISMRDMSERDKRLAKWVPKTELGKKVMAGEITDINHIFDQNLAVLEPEIIDKLLDLEEKVVDVKKTTRVIESGRKFAFRVTTLVGNRSGIVGIGVAKDTEKWPAIRKASKNARMHLIRVRRGCGSWECGCGAAHTVPFKVIGKSASVRVTFLPAPRGVGLVAGNAIKDVLIFAGITDVWTKVRGATDTKLNFIQADSYKTTIRIVPMDKPCNLWRVNSG